MQQLYFFNKKQYQEKWMHSLRSTCFTKFSDTNYDLFKSKKRHCANFKLINTKIVNQKIKNNGIGFHNAL